MLRHMEKDRAEIEDLYRDRDYAAEEIERLQSISYARFVKIKRLRAALERAQAAYKQWVLANTFGRAEAEAELAAALKGKSDE